MEELQGHTKGACNMTRNQAEAYQEALSKLAATLKIFYDSLTQVGFDDGHAMFLTLEFMKNSLSSVAGKI